MSPTERFYIDGAFVAPLSDDRSAVINPATEEPVATIALGTIADVDRAVVVAGDFGGFLALHLAAVHPERVAGLVLVNTTACVRQLPGYEIGLPDDILQARFDPLKRGWLDGADAADEPPRSEAPFVEVASRYRRSAVRLSDVRHLAVYLARLDLREEIRGIGCPTLVIHRRENEFIPSSHGHYLAHTVASSRFQEFPGAEQTMWAGDQADILETISEFIAALGTAHR